MLYLVIWSIFKKDFLKVSLSLSTLKSDNHEEQSLEKEWIYERKDFTISAYKLEIRSLFGSVRTCLSLQNKISQFKRKSAVCLAYFTLWTSAQGQILVSDTLMNCQFILLQLHEEKSWPCAWAPPCPFLSHAKNIRRIFLRTCAPRKEAGGVGSWSIREEARNCGMGRVEVSYIEFVLLEVFHELESLRAMLSSFLFGKDTRPLLYKTKCHFISPFPTKLGGGWEKDLRKNKWLWVTKKNAMELGKVSKMLNRKWGNREKKACWGCRNHRKEENKSHLCIPRSPPKVKDFTLVPAAGWTQDFSADHIKGLPLCKHQCPQSELKKKKSNDKQSFFCVVGAGERKRLSPKAVPSQPGQPTPTAWDAPWSTALLSSIYPESTALDFSFSKLLNSVCYKMLIHLALLQWPELFPSHSNCMCPLTHCFAQHFSGHRGSHRSCIFFFHSKLLTSGQQLSALFMMPQCEGQE